MGDERVAWKHIGFHGHSVGTFSADVTKIHWRSALYGNDEDMGTSRVIPSDAIKGAKWSIFGRKGHLRIQTTAKKIKHELRFDGFPHGDFEKVKETFRRFYDVTVEKNPMSSAGASYGKSEIEGRNLVFRHMVLEEAQEEGEEFEPRVGDEMLSLDLAEVSQCVLPGNNRHEIELQFPESDTHEAGTDNLVAIRFYIPPDADFENSDKSTPSNAEILQKNIMKSANIKNTTGDMLVEFPETKGTFLTPRGRYAIELYDNFMRMRGNKYDYRIKYDDISRLFLLPKPDDVHFAFVIALDKPIRQGQQRYQMLVLQTNKEPDEIAVNLDEETLQKEYNGDLQPVMTGSFSNLIAKMFKIIARKKVFIPGKFKNANQQTCVKCALKANEGHLYPLEKQFIFIHKPPVLIRFDEVDSVEFQRYAGGQGSTRNFDLCVTLKSSDTGPKEYTFSGIDRSDYTSLYNFLSGKKIKIKNLEGVGQEERPTVPIYNEDQIYGVDGAADEEESEDEDFDENEKESSDSESIDDDDLGSEVDDDLDSDIEEARKNAGIPTKKKSKKREAETADDDDDDEEEEKPKKKKKKKSSPDKKEAARPPAAKKKSKDKNAPKKALSAYNYYMNKNRPRIKAENPTATFGELAKIVSEQFKKLSPEDRQKYDDMASKDKLRYADDMKTYTPPADSGGSPAKKKKAKKDPNAPKKGKTSFMFFSNSIRSTVKTEKPDLSFGEIGKEIGERWKALNPEEKGKYEKMAEDDKARAKKEMAAYKLKKAAEEDDGDDEKMAMDGSDSDS